MQLADVKLDDKYTLESGRVYLNGIQALTRLLIMQRVRDGAEERRLERRLITDCERTVEELEHGLRAGNLELAVEVGTLPATIRGYGHVKRRNIDAAKTREAALLAQLRNPRVQPVQLAA
jgi:hypothetical protein